MEKNVRTREWSPLMSQWKDRKKKMLIEKKSQKNRKKGKL